MLALFSENLTNQTLKFLFPYWDHGLQISFLSLEAITCASGYVRLGQKEKPIKINEPTLCPGSETIILDKRELESFLALAQVGADSHVH